MQNQMKERSLEQLRRMNSRNIERRMPKSLVALQQAASDSIFSRIAAATRSKEAWSILKLVYEGSDMMISVRLQAFRTELETLNMKESVSVEN